MEHENTEFSLWRQFGASVLHPEKTRRRARQNVILELGYFLAKLGRNKVCCLYLEGVEQPSDYDGVLYVPYDLNPASISAFFIELGRKSHISVKSFAAIDRFS